jgi:HSP20 family molecular chaperone IbpA
METMQRNPQLLIAGILFTALLPVSGYGYADDTDDWSYRPDTGPANGYYASGSLRVQTGMTGDGYYVRVYPEGFRPEDVQVYVRGNRLVLQTSQVNYYRSTGPDARSNAQWHMRLRRQLPLPYDADWTRMSTSTDNGVLDIYIPRRNEYLPEDPYLER